MAPRVGKMSSGGVRANADLRGRRPWSRGAGTANTVQKQEYMQHTCVVLRGAQGLYLANSYSSFDTQPQ